MRALLVVCAGGALGSGARYLVASWALRTFGTGFPWGTWIVNMAGSLAIGALMQRATTHPLPDPLRLLLVTGVLGGFTTYSAFNHETLRYLQAGSLGMFGLNLAATVGGCLASGLLGIWIARIAQGF